MAKRQALLAKAPDHRFITERRAQLALERGRPDETLQLLSQTTWPRKHQRYVRTELWKLACAALGKPDVEVPETLNEDNLARFGAYWSCPAARRRLPSGDGCGGRISAIKLRVAAPPCNFSR